jgi:hypothetical protein
MGFMLLPMFFVDTGLLRRLRLLAMTSLRGPPGFGRPVAIQI